jgi:hypothetical protein
MGAPALIAITLVATACQSTTASGPSPQSGHVIVPDAPCNLFTQTEVASALGIDVKSEHETTSMPDDRDNTAFLCVYDTGPPYASLTIQIQRPVSRAQFEQELEKQKRQNQVIETIRGLGDEAFIEGTVTISVLSGEVNVIASMQHLDNSQGAEGALRTIGEIAVRNLRE